MNANYFSKVAHTPDYFKIEVNADFEHKTGTTFSDYRLRYGQSAQSLRPDEHQLRFVDVPTTKIHAKFRTEYVYRPEWGSITSFLEVSAAHLEDNRNFYRLDRLGASTPEFGALPSTTAALLQTLDTPNSYDSRHNSLNGTLGARCTIWLGGKLPNQHITFTPTVNGSIERLTYRRDALHAHPRRNQLFFLPTLSWGFDNCHITYRMHAAYPELFNLLDYTDNADPLNLYCGNPHLQRSTSHKVTFSRSWWKWKEGKKFFIDAAWDVTHNAVAHGQTYDAATGVRTFSPRNVDGNWHAEARMFWERPFDKDRQTLFTSETKADFRNSVDYVTERSTVQNFAVQQNLRFNAKIKRVIIDGSIGARYWHATSARKNFQTINSFDVTYGLNMQLPLPGQFAFSTDCKLYQRAGYSDASMNDLRFVANAHLEKTFLRGRLNVALEGYDIFGGLSNVTKVINAQGIVETWYNSLPSYAMIQVSYKLSQPPKKRNR